MLQLQSRIRRLFGISAVAAALACPALAQDAAAVFQRGDAAVTGFSGTKSDAAQGDPADETFIDLDGAAMRIMPLRANGPPAGQLLSIAPSLQIKARDVGQVFAIAIDDGLKPAPVGVTPNIYLGATSAYSLHIVIPDADGDGRPERVKKGHPSAEWMAGQFGPNAGPGSIWKIDGTTGAVSLFATLPGNSGPGVGDVVYDTSSLHFYASDLDTGLIHRIDSSGNLIDTFDHGVKGRESAGMAAIADDGAVMDIKNATFDSQNPTTWRMTEPARRIAGLGLSGGRLYYAVAEGPAIWSISLKLDGSFGDDPRREFEIPGTPANHPVSDIAFDGQGMMVVAQRGGVRGSYDFTNFTDAKASVVFRYRREIPDDPATPGAWIPVPEEFAIGFPPDHRNTAGGIALGYGYDEQGQVRPGQCGATLWSTGDDLQNGAPDGVAGVHGLQGADRLLVRPDNEPPAKSYLVDYDGKIADPAKTGQVGDVEIWQPCDKASFGYGPYAPMPYLPPNYVPPSYYPPGFVPPGTPPVGWPTWDYNLRVDKAAVPAVCAPGGAGFLCTYTVRVTNTGPDPYIGPVTITDKLPAAPAGATMTFDNQPPWLCMPASATEYDCTHAGAVLWPTTSIDLKVTVDTPAPPPVCALDNIAYMKWPLGFGDSNPADDFAWATSTIPAGHCPPPAGSKTNLKLTKLTWKPICTDKAGYFDCEYFIQVRNDGGAVYNGDIKINETIPAGTTPTFFIGGTGSCTNAAPYSCTFANDVLNPGAARVFGVRLKVPNNLVDDLACKATNKAKIVEYPSGHDLNTDATDDEAEATATLPGNAQQCPGLELSNLKMKKTDVTGGMCQPSGGNWECKFKITVQNFGKPMHNPVKFFDSLSKTGTMTFQTPANWTCAPWGFPNTFTCETDNAGLDHMEKVDILATVKIPIAPTNQCHVKNWVNLTNPNPGSSQNTFGGDDMSDATAQLAPIWPINGNPYCLSPNMDKPDKPITTPLPQETNLTITKTAGASTVTAAGQTTPFVITVTNTGPGVYNDAIVVRETLPGEPVNATWSAPWVCEGQTMAGQPNDALCTHPNVELQPNQSVALNLEVEMPNSLIAPSGSTVTCGYTNKVAIEEAAGGTPQNSNAGDDTATAKVTFAPFEKHGQQFCGADDITTPPPPPQVCPQGWSNTPVAGKCCPPNTLWNGKRCSKDDPPATCKPERCDRDETWNPSSCACVSKQCPDGTVGKYPNCKPIVDDCPTGFTGTPPNCRRIIVDPPRCPPNSDTRFDYPNCRCKPGFAGTPPNCSPIVDPPGDSCKPKACGRGKVWDSKDCACITRDCPKGTIGDYPNCKPKECPSGFVGSPPNCKPKECSSGTVGKFPNCKKLPTTCKPGFKGTPPNCKKIVEPTCPDGFTGRPPKCKRIPPPKCPSGFTGTPPNCKRVQVTCPPGMVGRPPNCRTLPKPCPPGFVGKVPNCKRVQIPRALNMPPRARPGPVRQLAR